MFSLDKLKSRYPKVFDLYENINDDYLGLLAAGVAFYFLMASFPALAAAISLYGIFSDPHFIEDQINGLSKILPREAIDIFGSQAKTLSAASGGALGVSFLLSTLLALYSSTKGVGALIKGLNIAYNEKEKRSALRLTATGFVLTAGLLVYMLLALTLIAGMPAIFSLIKIPGVTFDIYLLLRWPLLFMTALLGLEFLYAFAPCHSRLNRHWMSWGSLTATALWTLASACFSLFVSNFGNYNETYGSISAIVILLLWFWMSAMTILLGAEINFAFSDHQNRNDVNLKAGSENQD